MEARRSEIEWKSEPELRTPNSHLRPAERVFLLDSFWCYLPAEVDLPVNDLPAIRNGHVTFGSLNNFCKINRHVLDLWARLLGRVPDSRLLLLSPAGSHRQHVMEFLGRKGILPHRVEFQAPRPRREYLELYHRLDVALDPSPYAGHTTSLDALWMGVPVVTLAGSRAVSRAGLSQMSNLGLRELVASSGDEYLAIATGLSGDLPRLAELRRTLRSRMETSLLMNASEFTRQIEAAYRAMWQDWCATAAP
jgi:predicted O-linked N-acetylglucosamine transferase (SPINDLY family)